MAKMDSVIGCVSCGKPALLVGDEAPKQFPACFWCLAERRPGAAELFLNEVRAEERDRVLWLIDDALAQSRRWGARGTHDLIEATARRIREGK